MPRITIFLQLQMHPLFQQPYSGTNMPFITYPQQNGQVAVIVPADPSLSIEDIAAKDVPAGVPYKIVDFLNIDNTFFNSYIFDETQGAVLDFSKAQAQQTGTFNQIVYDEYAHRAVKTLSGISNTLPDSDWKTLVTNAQFAIATATTTEQLVAAIVPVQEAIAANAAI